MIAADADAMAAIGAAIGVRIRPGDVVALSGGLGAGKTTLARGLIGALGYGGEVPSPSFAIVQPYEPPSVSLPLAHVDLYRIEDSREVVELGLDEWLEGGAMVVEWPDLLGDALLADALRIAILPPAVDGGRVLTAMVPGAWEGRWPPR